MDPPYSDQKSFKRKLRLTALVFGLNCLIMGVLVILAYQFLSQKEIQKIVNTYNWSGHAVFFNVISLKNLWVIFYTISLINAVAEEILYRYSVLYLIKKSPKLQSWPIATCLFVLSNTLWTSTHINIIWPVFIAGLSWSWLTFKTRSIWPSIVCHTLADFGLYLMVQFLIYYKFIEVIQKIK